MKPVKEFRLWVRVLRWVDGDTFTGVLDQGYLTFCGRESDPVRFRCALINAPETKGDTLKAGLAAWTYAHELAPEGDYPCQAFKQDEFGRLLVDLILPDGRLFSDAMLTAGHAVPYTR